MSSAPPHRLLSVRAGIGAAALLLAISAAPPSAEAQSCVLTRLDTPVLSAFNQEFVVEHPQPWQFSLGYRYGYSFRHFEGTDEQEHRVEENSQVVNNVSILDASLRYSLDSQTTFTLSIPYYEATRSAGLRNENREIVRRYVRSETSGIGDISLVASRLLWDPNTHGRGNLSVSLGVDFPTGDHTQEQTRLSLDENGNEVAEVSVADYSVQPGDGAWGIILGTSGYGVLNPSGTLAYYGSATYIFQPETTNGVALDPDDEGEEFVSATDQYVARLGLQYGPRSWRGFSVGLGGRIEGVPVHDVFGSSYGRRRPGYMVSVEPTLSWSRGRSGISVALPWAVQRNRQQSLADQITDDHGDAAFPDYLVVANYSVRF